MGTIPGILLCLLAAAASGSDPLWVDAAGRPNADARVALRILGSADLEGLDPDDYGAADLAARALKLDRGPVAIDMAAFDAGLTAGMLRYLHHVHLGRVDPRALGFRLRVPDHRHDFTAILLSALTSHRIAETAEELTPQISQYRALRRMLARYRSLAADAPLAPLPASAAAVRPGDSYAGITALCRRLIAFGDLSPGTSCAGEGAVYEGDVVEAVRRFQIRHGIENDGILGRRTQAALQVPIGWRVRQIELALERLRWLPDLSGGRVLAVNIPTFHLWAWDAIGPTSAPSFGMGVIVGRALRTQTPVLAADMQSIIFRPYWNVPRSILVGEILPALARDPGYLGRHDMEIVRGQGDKAQPVPATPENLDGLRSGQLRVRQRPGPKNALGLIKFVFPNEHDVYLHGTPAPELFGRSRRDYSHGCVRVEDPVRLAEWALADQPEWTRGRILDQTARTRQVNLTRPIQVLLLYTTAEVMPEDGTLRFADDIYGHDARLDRALASAAAGLVNGADDLRPFRAEP